MPTLYLCIFLAVLDPNTLNLDPSPGFRPNLDPDPDLDPGSGSRVVLSILKEKIQNNYREK